MIRQATTDDEPRVLEMARKFLETSHYGRMMTAAPFHLEAYLAVAMSSGLVLVHQPGTKANGLEARPDAFIAIVGPQPHPISGESYAEELAWWVEPELRGLHVGTDLLAEAEKWGAARGICVYKMIAPAGSAIGRFYEKHGYYAVETAYLKRLKV